MFLHRIGKVNAPEFPPRLTWLGSDALRLKQLRGRPVLIDFWTYSCVNCLRTTPHLIEWYKKYHDLGLEIIGVHTPEFEFERQTENVERAVRELKIPYPVVLDNNYKIWNLYSNRWWPRKFLIDATGAIVYDHVGEGGYAATEEAIQKALMAIGVTDLPAIKPSNIAGGGICYRTTPETYLGFMRGRYGNAAGMAPNVEHVYDDHEQHEEDLVYLHGHWRIKSESVCHTRELPLANEYLALRYSAFSVNCVMGSTNKKSAKVYIELDGQTLPEDMTDGDIKYDSQGRSYINVKHHRMYKLVDSDTYHTGTLKLKTAADNLELFAFTFGGCREM